MTMTGHTAIPNVSMRQLAVLTTVANQPPPHTVRSLAEGLGLSKPAICRALDHLGKRGLLARRPDPSDRRSVLVTPTASLHEWLPRMAQDVRVLLAGLPEVGERQAKRDHGPIWAWRANEPEPRQYVPWAERDGLITDEDTATLAVRTGEPVEVHDDTGGVHWGAPIMCADDPDGGSTWVEAKWCASRQDGQRYIADWVTHAARQPAEAPGGV